MLGSVSKEAIFACLFAALLPVPALAANPISEIRGGAYYHDAFLVGDTDETPKADLNLDVLFNSPHWLGWAFAPRPHIGGTLNFGGGTSLAFVGLDWTFDLFDNVVARNDAVFFGFSLDGAIHNGPISSPATEESDSFGCRLNFHESASLGYRWGHNNLMLTIEHMSNASLCSENDGLTNAGVRYGYHF